MSNRPVNLKDVAAKAGVSITTVSHVINKTRFVKPETAAAVEAAIDGALGSIQAAEDSASNIDTSTITASAPDTSALHSAAARR